MQDALKAIFLDRVNVLSYYDSYIMSTRSKVQLPSVVCLKHYQKPNREVRTRAVGSAPHALL
jgi:hypothetical protein